LGPPSGWGKKINWGSPVGAEYPACDQGVLEDHRVFEPAKREKWKIWDLVVQDPSA